MGWLKDLDPLLNGYHTSHFFGGEDNYMKKKNVILLFVIGTIMGTILIGCGDKTETVVESVRC